MNKTELEKRIRDLELELNDLKSKTVSTSLANKKSIEEGKDNHDSEDWFRSLFEEAPLSYQSLDINGNFIEVNQKWLETLGYSRREVIGKQFVDFLSSEYKDTFRQRFQSFKEKGEVHSEFEMIHKNGTKLFIAFEGKIGHSSDGKFKQTHCILQDITERNKSKELLRNSQLLLESSIESHKDTIILMVDNNYQYLYFNKVHSDSMKTAYNKDVKIGMNILDCVTDDEDRRILKDNYDRALSGEYHMNIREYGDVNYAMFESFFNPVRTENNKIIGVNILARDITVRILAERALQESEEKFKSLMQQSPFVVELYDLNGLQISVNKAYEELWGFPAETTVNRFNVLKSKEVVDSGLIEFIRRAYKGESVNVPEYIFNPTGETEARGEGRVRWLNTRVYPIKDVSEKVLNIVIVHQDITERKFAEEELLKSKEKAEESERLKTVFLANMSHEIRTPMNGILGFTQLLNEPDLTVEKQKEFIKTIEFSGHRMLNTINSIIDISKIESGIINVAIEKVYINDKIKLAYNFFKQDVESKGLQFSFKNGLPSEEAIIYTDNEKVYGIITNLIKNAIKFTDDGSIEFGYKKMGKFLEFYVKDTGVGLSRKDKEIIFERFRQADDSNERIFEGSGLGLSIAKSYVEMLGGEIWVESEKKQGSIFYFTIPYNAESKDIVVINDAAPEKHEEVQMKKLKILVAEDDGPSFSLLKIILKKISAEIILAKTGDEAIVACRNNPDIDLVLMDIEMPEMDGYIATRQIRLFNKDVVIIAQTAYALSYDKKKSLEAGCDDYISKPIKKPLLLELIRKHCNK